MILGHSCGELAGGCLHTDPAQRRERYNPAITAAHEEQRVEVAGTMDPPYCPGAHSVKHLRKCTQENSPGFVA